MVHTPERKVKDKVTRILKDAGVYYFFAATHGYGRAGIPDLVCCVDGFFLGIECKAGNGKVTPLQQNEMAAINRAGGCTLVVNEDNISAVSGLIKLIKGRTWGR